MSVRVKEIIKGSADSRSLTLAEESEENGRVNVLTDGNVGILYLTRDEATKLGKELLSWAYSVKAEVELDKMTFKKKGT